ncbi:MAG TPA: hydantoinase B/oxoprolinase family protein [Dehalococcoidia bacterium]|nr:hydantoinase B/oxoprolinase family protein [Dehalococcoidia bacterium]
MATKEAGTTVDAFTTEVIRGAVVAITREMKVNLQRTAYNTIIYEAEDFTVGLFDAEGNTISIGLGLPMFIRGLSDTIKAKLEHWGRDGIEPGDILLTNDAYTTGSHLNHMVFTVPVFHEDELVAFSSSMAHWPDVGGVAGTITRDIYSEGLQLPFVKIYKAGKLDQELAAIIRMNVRFPERAMGDFRAQIAAIRTGERRVSELLQRYGTHAFKESIRHIFDQSERLARAAVRSIPDGIYEAEAFMDDDGVAIGKHVPIKIKVIVEGDEMTIDFTDVGAQVAGYFNSGPTAGRSAAQVAFKCLTTPTLLPINHGAVRPVKVILPPGRVISATKPAAMYRWMAYPMTVVDTIFKALAPACPERVIAGHHADLAGLAGGGWGAKFDEDGMSATVCVNDGDTHNAPTEATEARQPGSIVVRRELRLDSGGPGKFRGGLGVARETRNLLPRSRFFYEVERTECAPWGLFGGKDALANRIARVHKDGTVEVLRGKTGGMELEAGEGHVIEVGGGGGFGNPLERDVERVLADVRAEYVSLESARDDYGVVITKNGRQYEVDAKATDALRKQMLAADRR